MCKDVDVLIASELDFDSLYSLYCTCRKWRNLISQDLTRKCSVCKKKIRTTCQTSQCEEFAISIEKTLIGSFFNYSMS